MTFMKTKLLTLMLLAGLTSRADQILYSRTATNTWRVVVTGPTSIPITNFTQLQVSTDLKTWKTVAQDYRENATRFYTVTNTSRMFFRLLNSPVL